MKKRTDQLSDKSIPLKEYADLDLDRKCRCGFPEFLYGASKTTDQMKGIIRELLNHKQPILATRVVPDAGKALVEAFPEGEYDSLARSFCIRKHIKQRKHSVLIVCAGTSDLPVAQEAKNTAELCGLGVSLLTDCGVAGIHRLLARMPQLQAAEVIIAIAGMEGALPSVIAGLVSCPVIAVPTSVGYGSSFQGMTALLAMLNSCGSGVTVVNIDNGFGAACAASRILR